MERELSHGRTEGFTKAATKTTKRAGSALTSGLTGESTREAGCKESNTELDSIPIKKVSGERASGKTEIGYPG